MRSDTLWMHLKAQASRSSSTTKNATESIAKRRPITCASMLGSLSSDACIQIPTKLCQSWVKLPTMQLIRNAGSQNMLFTMAGASLSLGEGHCYKLSVLTMQQFSIRKMHIPSCCSAAKHRSRTKRRYLIVTSGAPHQSLQPEFRVI